MYVVANLFISIFGVYLKAVIRLFYVFSERFLYLKKKQNFSLYIHWKNEVFFFLFNLFFSCLLYFLFLKSISETLLFLVLSHQCYRFPLRLLCGLLWQIPNCVYTLNIITIYLFFVQMKMKHDIYYISENKKK